MENNYIKRGAGVLLPLSSLPSDYSIGNFGIGARNFIDFLADSGFTYWQVLPFCMTDEYNSPYKSFSAFAGNHYFIDLDALYKKQLLTREELDSARQSTPYVCEYPRLYKERMALLAKAAERCDYRAEVEGFIDSEPYLLQACRFLAIRDANDNKSWYDWKHESCDEARLFAWKFVQYEFFAQWQAVRSYAALRGIKVIGDVPIYVSPDSADVWANRELFLTDEKGRPAAVAGVPPDYFAADGQLWGNPLYDWKRMEKDGFAWWRDRMSFQLKMFDGVRLDHFRGFESFWSVPADAKTAKEGHWVKGPGLKLTKALKEVAGDKLIIAEDLGVITDEVAELRDESGFPGMRVLQFAFLGDRNSPHLPHNYINQSVVYTGTHDNNTLLGWVWELDEGTRRDMLEYFGYSGDWNACYGKLIRSMLASTAGIVIMPLQDLLGYGSDTRINRPGQAAGNWEYRVTPDQLARIDKGYYNRLNRLYARV